MTLPEPTYRGRKMPRRKRDDGQKNFTLTIGGITLEKEDDGEMSYFEPIARYEGVSEKGLQEVWHFLQDDSEIQELGDKLRAAVLKRMTEFGDKKQKKND